MAEYKQEYARNLKKKNYLKLSCADVYCWIRKQ